MMDHKIVGALMFIVLLQLCCSNVDGKAISTYVAERSQLDDNVIAEEVLLKTIRHDKMDAYADEVFGDLLAELTKRDPAILHKFPRIPPHILASFLASLAAGGLTPQQLRGSGILGWGKKKDYKEYSD